VLEFKLSLRANRDRAEQFLLQQQPGLHQRRRRAGVLQRSARQRPVSFADHAADIDLPERLRVVRRVLLPGQPNDVNGHLLPRRPSAKRPQQDTVQAAHFHSQAAAAAMLPGWSNSVREPAVLCGSECDDGWHVLFRPGRYE
jgi:hypothetical protein